MHNYAALPLLYYHELIWFYTKVSRELVSVTAIIVRHSTGIIMHTRVD